MTDEHAPREPGGDPFDEQLAERLGAAADPIDGSGVTRQGIAAAVAARQGRARARTFAAAAAVLVVAVAGVAVASATDDGTQRVASVASTTEAAGEPCLWEGRGEWAGWIEITAPQIEALRAAGALRSEASTIRPGSVYHLDWLGYRALSGSDGELSGKQLFGLGYQSVLPLLSDAWSGSLSDPQRAEIEAGVYPTLDAAQVQALFREFAMVAVPAGGLPITATGAEYFSGAMFTEEQVRAIVEYERTLEVPTGAVPDPCDPGGAQESATTATRPGPTTTSVPESTRGPSRATSTTVAPGAPVEPEARWILYLYVLDGRQNLDGSVTTGIERMGEIMGGAEPDEQQEAADARAAAAELGLDDLWEGAMGCDEGAALRLGLDPEREPLGISVWFDSEDAARTVFERLEASTIPDIEPAVRVEQWCTGRDSEG